MDTFFQSLATVTTLDFWLNATMIPANNSVQLTTTFMDQYLLPGIEAYYGPDLPVNIYFDFQSFGNIDIFEDNQEMDGTTTVLT